VEALLLMVGNDASNGWKQGFQWSEVWHEKFSERYSRILTKQTNKMCIFAKSIM
jgi:hypothetical protein